MSVKKKNTVGCATMNECYNKQFLSIKSGGYKEHRCYNEQFLSIKSGCYNKHGRIQLAAVARACAWRVGPSCFD